MCIIACKPAGIKLPTWSIIENMWYSNPDGAGLAFYNPKTHKVRIEKGFMSLSDFEDKLNELDKQFNLQKLAVIMHFRIATHGGITRSNCHPFPISDNTAVLGKPFLETRIGVAHNGIIDITPRSKDISDTMEYIASQLSQLVKFCPQFYKNKHAMQMIKNAIGSKMAFITPENRIYTIGDFTEDEGILYSNASYKGWGRYRNGKFGCYGWDDDYGYGSYWDSYEYDTKSKCYVLKKGGTKSTEPDEEDAKMRMLMDLYPYGSTVTDGNTTLEGGEFYLDKEGRVWEYDCEGDACLLLTDVWACNEDGIRIPYVEKEAELMPCYPEYYGIALFDEEVSDR